MKHNEISTPEHEHESVPLCVYDEDEEPLPVLDDEPEDIFPQFDEEVREDRFPLFEPGEVEEFHVRWINIESRFVEDPYSSAEEADALLAEVMKSLTASFANERSIYQDQHNRDEATEQLQIAMRRYSSFFNRLLTVEL